MTRMVYVSSPFSSEGVTRVVRTSAGIDRLLNREKRDRHGVSNGWNWQLRGTEEELHRLGTLHTYKGSAPYLTTTTGWMVDVRVDDDAAL